MGKAKFAAKPPLMGALEQPLLLISAPAGCFAELGIPDLRSAGWKNLLQTP